MESSTPSSSLPQYEQSSIDPFFHSPRDDKSQSDTLPMATNVSPTKTSYNNSFAPQGDVPKNIPPHTACPQESSEILRRWVSFTEILNLVNSALMFFSRKRGQKIYSQLSTVREEVFIQSRATIEQGLGETCSNYDPKYEDIHNLNTGEQGNPEPTDNLEPGESAN